METGANLLLSDGLGPDNVAVMVDDVQRGEARIDRPFRVGVVYL